MTNFWEFVLIGPVTGQKMFVFIMGMIFSGCIGALGGIEMSEYPKLNKGAWVGAFAGALFFLILNYPLSHKY